MAIVSHLHHFFNADTCQSYIHTLRWKDRPLQCPRCQSHNVGPWGTYHYQPGLKRYRCQEKACKRTFNDLTGTLEFITIKSSVATGSGVPGSCAGHSSVPSPDPGHPASTSGCGL